MQWQYTEKPLLVHSQNRQRQNSSPPKFSWSIVGVYLKYRLCKASNEQTNITQLSSARWIQSIFKFLLKQTLNNHRQTRKQKELVGQVNK